MIYDVQWSKLSHSTKTRVLAGRCVLEALGEILYLFSSSSNGCSHSLAHVCITPISVQQSHCLLFCSQIFLFLSYEDNWLHLGPTQVASIIPHLKIFNLITSEKSIFILSNMHRVLWLESGYTYLGILTPWSCQNTIKVQTFPNQRNKQQSNSFSKNLHPMIRLLYHSFSDMSWFH